ncbi:MAG: signal peptidase I [Planctomycetes bacterium]|jgi:signal peptidase I|nr:signal peptidase I [Planctomycetota bacterium]
MTIDNKPGTIEWLRTYGKTILITVAVVFVIRTLVAEPFFIPSSSMEPTLKRLDRILVSKISYAVSDPSRWDVLVFRSPEDGRSSFVKRVVGMPGEKLQIVDGEVFINDELQEKPATLRSIEYSDIGRWGTTEPLPIPAGSYFVLGDNSDSSNDSRRWKEPFVTREDIIGKAVTIIWPPGRIHLIR